jgi:hypothetical protein
LTAVDSVEVRNSGTAPLTVDSLWVTHPDFGVQATGFTLDPDESRSVEVSFTPSTEGEIAGQLVIANSDPGTPEVVVLLTGVGVLPPLPILYSPFSRGPIPENR